MESFVTQHYIRIISHLWHCPSSIFSAEVLYFLFVLLFCYYPNDEYLLIPGFAGNIRVHVFWSTRQEIPQRAWLEVGCWALWDLYFNQTWWHSCDLKCLCLFKLLQGMWKTLCCRYSCSENETTSALIEASRAESQVLGCSISWAFSFQTIDDLFFFPFLLFHTSDPVHES